MQKQDGRIAWLDGLKGILCVLIFAHHFCLLFFPAIHYGAVAPTHANGVDTYLSQSPFSVILNGNYMVALFCLISAVVISRSIMQTQEKEKAVGVVVKRYLRLMLPLFVIGFITFLFLQFGWFTNQDVAQITGSPWASQYYKEPFSFWTFLYSALVKTWFFGDSMLSNSFWMLSDLFLGTFVCVVLSIITWKYPKKAWAFYSFLTVAFACRGGLKLAFILGTFLAWMTVYAPKLFQRYVGVAALLIGIILGGFPSGVMPTNFYRHFTFMGYANWHIWGAALTVYGVFACGILQKVLAIKPFCWLGKISYAVYLLHIWLLFSFSTIFFLWTYQALGYMFSVVLCFVVSCALLIGLAFLYEKYVERGCNCLQRRLLKALEDKKINSDEKQLDRVSIDK